ncbi:hypothetical protein LCGC14_1040900 [marine sediment metagenome]|uniref:Uncharacterized protein n=1 Tax=marine sediment metagenome TaxID=412755 RepID=A0A0F9NDE9_9ZZZZ
MAKTTQKLTWAKPIKEIGNGYIKFIAKVEDIGANVWYAGTGMMIGNNGAMIKFATTQPDYPTGVTIAEEIVDNDLFFIAKKNGAEILHNQKLASAYDIGTAVYKTAAGIWTLTDESTAESLLHTTGFVIGPADRFTSGVLKGINDALTATEPVDILI